MTGAADRCAGLHRPRPPTPRAALKLPLCTCCPGNVPALPRAAGGMIIKKIHCPAPLLIPFSLQNLKPMEVTGTFILSSVPISVNPQTLLHMINLPRIIQRARREGGWGSWCGEDGGSTHQRVTVTRTVPRLWLPRSQRLRPAWWARCPSPPLPNGST